MDRNSAAEVHSAYRQHLEREITRLCSHDRDYGFDCRYTARAGVGGIERGLNDRLGPIAGRGYPRSRLGLLRDLFTIAEEIVDVRNADAGTDVLVTHVIEPLAHEGKQPHLRFIGGSEVGMPTFGAVSTIFAGFP